jgi:4-hydroxy-4-methyl-2-oxoglutarate aldolase
MAHVKLNITRPSADLVAEVAKYPTATLHEAQGRRGALDSIIKPVAPSMQLCGPAFTVKAAPGDNLMLQIAISYAQPGDVIIVTTGPHSESGGFGDVLCNSCVARKIGGLVMDAGVRDGKQIIEMGFPVFTTGLCIKGTVKETLGTINGPIVIGGEVVRPGDIVRGDMDGIVIVRPEEAPAVCQRSYDREKNEEKKIAELRTGKTFIQVQNLEAMLKAKGLTIEQ